MDKATAKWVVDMLVHLHDMSHAIAGAIADLAAAGVDAAKLAAITAKLNAKIVDGTAVLAAAPKLP